MEGHVDRFGNIQRETRKLLDDALVAHNAHPYGGKQKEISFTDTEYLSLAINAQEIGGHIYWGELIDMAGFKRVVQKATADNPTLDAFSHSIRSWRAYFNGIAKNQEHVPQYFPRDILEEIRSLWGVVDAGVIYQKYVLDRIPSDEQWSGPAGGVGGNG